MPLFKRLLKALVVPVLILAISGLLSVFWSKLVFLLFRLHAFTDIFGFLTVMPYFILSASAIAGARYNNTGYFFSSAYLILLYFLNRLYSVEQNNHVILSNAFFALSPLFFIFFSLQSRKRFLSVRTLNNLAFVFVAGLLVYLLGKNVLSDVIEPNIPFRFRDGFLFIIEKIDAFLFLDSSTKDEFAYAARFFLIFIGFSWFAIRLAMKHDPDSAGYLGVIAAIMTVFYTTKPENEMIFFSSAGFIFMAALLEASFMKAYVDELTGIGGRRSLEDAMINLGKKYAIAMFDIDHFKKFNDTYGHEAGDQVLKLVATRLNGSFGRNAYRYGGEEFTVVFPGKNAKEAFPLLDSFRADLADHKFIIRETGRKKSSANKRGQEKSSSRKSVVITASMGVADSIAFPGEYPKNIMKIADQALYKSKQAGRNCVSIA
ncbi:GGDEF domain-containing protein [Desulforegula conservatrix]|uniref:GGDEF domain-containing protein n=1 Tax=Desulforegula conservatrix TaxID=153026 RepID=UPI000429716D|nr:GGDEF domain-containing protein [Desulforegula conservatrix]